MRHTLVRLKSRLKSSTTEGSNLPAALTCGKSYKVSEDGSFYDNGGQVRYAKHFKWETCWRKPFETEGVAAIKLKKLTRKELVAMSKAFGHQEDGHHYTDMELQPLEATYLRYGLIGLQAAIHTKVDKYITRKKDDALIQLKKAQHCLEILTEMTELEKTYA